MPRNAERCCPMYERFWPTRLQPSLSNRDAASSVSACDRVIAEVERNGWWYRESKPGNRSKYIFVKDPNGYDIEILEARPA